MAFDQGRFQNELIVPQGMISVLNENVRSREGVERTIPSLAGPHANHSNTPPLIEPLVGPKKAQFF